MEVDDGERTGSIGVDQLQPMSFDEIRVVVRVMRNLCVPLKKPKRRVNDRPSDITDKFHTLVYQALEESKK